MYLSTILSTPLRLKLYLFLLHKLTKFYALNELLHLMNINCWKRSSFSEHHKGVKTLPAILNSLSTGTEEAGILRMSFAIWARAKYSFSLSFQNLDGSKSIGRQEAARYLSIISSTSELSSFSSVILLCYTKSAQTIHCMMCMWFTAAFCQTWLVS